MSERKRRARPPTEAEVDLWRKAVADAAPLTGRARRAPTPPRPRPRAAPTHVHDHADGREADAPVSRRPHVAARPVAAAAAHIDRATMTRLKSGRMPIDGRIDLHGMTAAAAKRNLTAFLRSSQATGRRAVLVITGRGLDPENLGRGVLKRETPHWLNALPDVVSGYAQADRRHGGAGAFYVRLRRKDKVSGKGRRP